MTKDPTGRQYSAPPQADTRNDLGYGRTSAKFHSPKKSGSSFPYLDEDDPALDDVEDVVDPEDVDAIVAKMGGQAHVTDFYSKSAINPFYFAAGNTKLSDCFERPDDVLKEVFSTGKSMAPVPGAYKGKTTGTTGGRRRGATSTYFSVSSDKKTGSRRGFSSSPPSFKIDLRDDIIDEDEFFDIKNAIDVDQMAIKNALKSRREIYKMQKMDR